MQAAAQSELESFYKKLPSSQFYPIKDASGGLILACKIQARNDSHPDRGNAQGCENFAG